jgi:hypothetical protein
MKEDVMILIDRKLKEALGYIDDETAFKVRELWKSITPAPACPSSSELIEEVNSICHEGLTNRGKKIKATIAEVLEGINISLDKEFIKSILELAKKHFPEDQYVSLLKNTKGVYERRNAPKQKFSERGYDLEVSLIICGSANLSRKAIDETKTALVGMRISEQSDKPSLGGVIYEKMVRPFGGWIFPILGVVIAGLISKWLGL